MKSNRILLATLAVLLAASLVAVAGEDKMAKMKADLGLTDAQVQQIEAKFAELKPIKERAMAVKTDLKTLESAATPDQKAIDAKKSELEGIKKEWTAKADSIYRSVLSKEQYAKYQTWQAEQEKAYAAANKKK